tara:strand:- start:4991 stop:5485 length:495 start_codon:yes stop_codon:yes gene_type:complete
MKMIKNLMTALPIAVLVLGTATLGMPKMALAENHANMAEYGTMHVTKSPTCGCCGAWVALAREAGYDVETTDTGDTTKVKLSADVPGDLWACHTAKIDGYVIEGHVPFAAIAKLLKERPDIAGISVPGMPAGSPGMGNDSSAQYDVIAFGGKAAAGEVYFQAGQ